MSSVLGRPGRPDRTFAPRGDIAARYDLVVAGGGVRALSIALACADQGARVALFAPGEIAAAADERAWPAVRAAHRDRLRIAAEAKAVQRLAKLARKLPSAAGGEATGCLTIADSFDEVDRLSSLLPAMKASGVEAWMVPAREVAALSPPIADTADLMAALYEPSAVTVDADALAMALAEAAAAAGASLFAMEPVETIERDATRATGLRLRDRTVEADAIVLADDFAAIRLIREGKGRLSLTREERVTLVTAANAPAIGPALSSGALRISRDREGAITLSGPLGADALARRALELAPKLAGLAVAAEEPVTVWTGVDGLPQVGPAEIEGVWLALGYGRGALSLAIPAADHLGALIAGRRGDPTLEPFAPTRRPVARTPERVR